MRSRMRSTFGRTDTDNVKHINARRTEAAAILSEVVRDERGEGSAEAGRSMGGAAPSYVVCVSQDRLIGSGAAPHRIWCCASQDLVLRLIGSGAAPRRIAS